MIKKLHNFKGIQYPNIFILLMMFVVNINFATTINELSATEIIACNAGADNTGTEFCLAEAQAKFKNLNDVKAFYLGLLDAGVPQNGTFNPSLQLIATNYSKNPIGTFKTTYTITDGNCTDSAQLAVTVVSNPNAGPDNTSNTYFSNEINSIMQSTSEAKNLFLSLLGQNIKTNGTFKPTIDEIIASYQQNPIGTFQTVYTLKNGQACEDSANLAITVRPSCNAGADNISTEFCLAEAQARFKNLNDVKAFYLGLLDAGVPQNGAFNPSLQLIATNYSKNPIGIFKTTYTITEGNCTDSTELAVKVVPNPNAGADNINNTFCPDQVNQILQAPDDAKNLFLSLLDPNTNISGTFKPSIEEIITSYQQNPIGTFQTVYTVKNGQACSDSANLAITVVESDLAGADNTNNILCYSLAESKMSSSENATNYFMSLVDANAPTNGTFTPSMTQLINQFSQNPIGTFSTKYTVSKNGCSDSSDLAFTVNQSSYAGKDNINNTMTRSEASNRFKGLNDVKTYYLGLLSPGVSQNGSFADKNLRLLVNQYSQNPIGTFKTVYTVTSGGCTDSAVLSLTIVEDSKAQSSASKAQTSSSNTSSSLVIYNLNGGVVKTTKVDATETFNKNSSTFSDSNLKKGIYIYKLNDGNGVISTKKIIVE